MSATRMKFWGWGPEDRQPPHEEVEQFGAAAREHLGFEPAEVERPPRVEDLELPPPRIEIPPALAEISSADAHERASHAYGKAYRDIVRAFRGRIENPPDFVTRPRERARGGEVLDWCAEAAHGGDPVRRRHERRGRRRSAP